jgi:hypothetical protein
MSSLSSCGRGNFELYILRRSRAGCSANLHLGSIHGSFEIMLDEDPWNDTSTISSNDRSTASRGRTALLSTILGKKAQPLQRNTGLIEFAFASYGVIHMKQTSVSSFESISTNAI